MDPLVSLLKQTALYALSGNNAFASFEHVVLVSSPQDTYAPFGSGVAVILI